MKTLLWLWVCLQPIILIIIIYVTLFIILYIIIINFGSLGSIIVIFNPIKFYYYDRRGTSPYVIVKAV